MSFAETSAYEHWEYLTEVIESTTKAQADFISERYPGVTLPKYAVVALMPRLNQLGEAGWELMHIEPVKVGTNGDMQISNPNPMYSPSYFCVFKRRKRF